MRRDRIRVAQGARDVIFARKQLRPVARRKAKADTESTRRCQCAGGNVHFQFLRHAAGFQRRDQPTNPVNLHARRSV